MGVGQEATFDLLAIGHTSAWRRLSAGRDPDVQSDPESMVLLQTDSVSKTASVSAPHHSGEERGDHFSFSSVFFFFFFFSSSSSEKNTLFKESPLQIKSCPKKDCILTGIMNEHKEIIQCSTNKIVFTYSMYCQWPITRCLQ